MQEITKRQKQRVAERWALPQSLENRAVGSFGPTKDYMLQCLSGDPGAKADRPDWLEHWLVGTFLKGRTPVEQCLTLCCTAGIRERNLAALGVFKHCTGIDISDGAIRKARQSAQEAGHDNIDYVVADLDRIELDRERYDVVFALGALHHISRLEHLVPEIRKALKPGGLLIGHDYIGPNYFALSLRHREIVNAAVHLIPPRLRFSTEQTFCPPAMVYPRWRRAFYEAWRLVTLRPSTVDFADHPLNPNWPSPLRWAYEAALRLSRFYAKAAPGKFRFGKVFDRSPETVRRMDPSEGVRAGDILPVIKANFDDVTIRYSKLSILHYALDKGFFRNYHADSPEDRMVLDMLIGIEKVMMQLGEIPPILAAYAARKQG